MLVLKRSIFICMPILSILLVFLSDRSHIDYSSGLHRIFLFIFNDTPLDVNATILFNIRLPRIFLALGIGMILAGSGVVMQNIFRNPLVDPYLLGISSGAAFGCAICIGFFSQSFLGIFAFIGAISTTLLIIFFARFASKSQISLVLVGIVLSSFLSAMAGLVKYFVTPDKAQTIVIWLLGSLSLATWRDVIIIFSIAIICFIPLFALRYRLNALALSDLESRSLGINATVLRFICIILVGLMCGVAVSISGTIGWIGLIVPHFVRLLVGANLVQLLPSSMLIGAFVLLLMDFFAKNITSNDLPVGAVCAIIGAPLFLIFLLFASKNKVF